jgi:hypothetical protein
MNPQKLWLAEVTVDNGGAVGNGGTVEDIGLGRFRIDMKSCIHVTLAASGTSASQVQTGSRSRMEVDGSRHGVTALSNSVRG